MAENGMIPRPSAPAVDRDGRLTREWYAYLQSLLSAEQVDRGDLEARLAALAQEIQGLAHSFQITAGPGITVQGTPEGGLVRLSVSASGVTPGTYTNATVTVGADGRVTAAEDGERGNLVAGSNVTLTGDLAGRLVGAGDVQISATGGGEGGGDDPLAVVEIFNDFLLPPATSNTGADFHSTVSNAVIESLTAPTNPGILKLRPVSTSSTQANVNYRGAPFVLGGGRIEFEALVWIDYNMGANVGQNFSVGLMSAETAGAGWGVLFRLLASDSAPRWNATVRIDGDNNYFATQGLPAIPNQKYKLRLVVSDDGSSVEAFIDGVSIGSTTIAAPGSFPAMWPRLQIWTPSGGTNADSHGHYVDYIRAKKYLSTPR